VNPTHPIDTVEPANARNARRRMCTSSYSVNRLHLTQSLERTMPGRRRRSDPLAARVLVARGGCGRVGDRPRRATWVSERRDFVDRIPARSSELRLAAQMRSNKCLLLSRWAFRVARYALGPHLGRAVETRAVRRRHDWPWWPRSPPSESSTVLSQPPVSRGRWSVAIGNAVTLRCP